MIVMVQDGPFKGSVGHSNFVSVESGCEIDVKAHHGVLGGQRCKADRIIVDDGGGQRFVWLVMDPMVPGVMVLVDLEDAVRVVPPPVAS